MCQDEKKAASAAAAKLEVLFTDREGAAAQSNWSVGRLTGLRWPCCRCFTGKEHAESTLVKVAEHRDEYYSDMATHKVLFIILPRSQFC